MKKFFIRTVMITAAAFLLTGCAQTTNDAAVSASTDAATAEYRTITPEKAKELIGTVGVVLLDVREQDEYDQIRIDGAVLLPVDDVALKAADVLPDKNATIIVYCRSGRRSAIAANELVGMGYTGVYDLGGIQDWPYETVSG